MEDMTNFFTLWDLYQLAAAGYTVGISNGKIQDVLKEGEEE